MNKPIATKLARAIGYHSLELLMFPLAVADLIDWKQLLPQDTFLERMERLSQQVGEQYAKDGYHTHAHPQVIADLAEIV